MIKWGNMENGVHDLGWKRHRCAGTCRAGWHCEQACSYCSNSRSVDHRCSSSPSPPPPPPTHPSPPHHHYHQHWFWEGCNIVAISRIVGEIEEKVTVREIGGIIILISTILVIILILILIILIIILLISTTRIILLKPKLMDFYWRLHVTDLELYGRAG